MANADGSFHSHLILSQHVQTMADGKRGSGERDGWIQAYHPLLPLRLQCHCNFQVTNGTATIPYTNSIEIERTQGASRDDAFAHSDIVADDLGDALDDSGAPQNILHLKVGEPIQLLQTLDTTIGLT
jgi:hypothetical protein